MSESTNFDELIAQVMRELSAAGLIRPQAQPVTQAPPAAAPVPRGRRTGGEVSIDLADPTSAQVRAQSGIDQPIDSEGVQALMSVTPARIGAGRAGPRPRTAALNRFTADAAVTQDALWRDVSPALLEQEGLFSVQTRITGGKEEYLLRPDLGRQLSDSARETIRQRCQPGASIQVCVGDGLSAAAIEANLAKILPVIQSGAQSAGLSFGTPFFIQYCRVGVMNDIGDLLKPEVLLLLIGERPGLGRADSMSVYMGYRPQSGHNDADRDVICNIYDSGGTNPLEAGAYAVQLAQKMIKAGASGVKLKLQEGG